ncbi:hypothetical protein CHU92_09180 [Flavobacterium cyanobacteriorum]|uniref:Cyclic nucleotide-binding protein n=1 Tax=Flavobacterium cyanobacteriorum TaxID=2022802 RepID=A0A255Z624_9FLAO|nr:DUF1003 domain-containing protein [Flavobacterium cyanobacteriorum]OYQ36882.1 hypothetical protein CHU92_09180 [Flavobacterium cyanobacteriorum]
MRKQKFISDVSGKEFPMYEKVPAGILRKPIRDLISQDKPDFDDNCSLSMSELNHYRERYITGFLESGVGQLSQLEEKVINSLKEKTLITDNPDADDKTALTFGQKLADRVAGFGGSWTFIILFAGFLFAWITLNIVFLSDKGFDPYPFILLNLILSCIAAIQAPVIMMSQNRQEEKDRERSQNDYMINLKSELEIRLLHEKLDHLILHQEQGLIEIQQVQIDMMNDILKRLEKK